ncbi:MAG TPA: ester cyclase [Ohtaekwangia sp.]|uniref:nuclear transport factor 2 family protein n=1 Tax=Ohtaekwangia sp. TaxID=2066019 RepID=UPI002F93574B
MKTKYILTLTAGVIFTGALFSCEKKELYTQAQAKIDSLQQEVAGLQKSQSQTEANKKLVAEFYQELFGDKNPEAIDKYIGDTYIQHNPILPDGKEPLKQAVVQWFKGAPKEKIDIHHLSADGDLVYIHTKATFGGKVSSIVDIFRLENNKIVEHWDVIQTVPEKSANPHPMF